LHDSGAAAGRLAAEIYDMEVVYENIHENPKNYTRFFALTKNQNEESRILNLDQAKPLTQNPKLQTQYKTTLQFELGEEPGSLYKSLRCFADRNIALTKIESRPIIGTEWNYRFYLDAMAPINSEKMQSAMNELKDYATDLRVLGSYNKGEYIST